ncbi:3'-5' exonuclease, partial [Lactobacillus crispatus]
NKGVLANKGIDIKTALLDLRKFLADRIVVGYNLPFDINFLNRDFKKYCHYSLLNECVDLLSAVKKKNVFLDNYHLSTVLENYNIKNSNPHNSLADAVATMELLKKLIKNDNYKIK